jgi:hypothetical protein
MQITSYSLLEPDTCAVSDKTGEIETGLSRSITLSSGVQACVSDKSLVDSLEGMVVWEYDCMTCPQMIVQLYKGIMKVYMNQLGIYSTRAASSSWSTKLRTRRQDWR